jgi:predicted  nucleic acid-binding Zn-ribbon protein
MCLEQCYNLKIKQLKIKLDNSEKKISELESEMDDLKLRIKLLEDVLSSIKTKNNSKP